MSDQVFTHQRSKNYGKVPSEVMHDLTLTDGDVRLYGHMHWRGGKPLQHYEGMTSMASMLGVSEKAISDRVKRLEARDWVLVVARGKNAETGRHQTPIYHVFEYQTDCIVFRQTYKPAPNESLRPKPTEVEVRKSRQGAGGNPKLKAAGTQVLQANSSSAGQQNSSSDGHPVTQQNSSSDYPEGYTEIFYPEKDSASANASILNAFAEGQLPTVNSPTGEKPDPFQEYVETMNIEESEVEESNKPELYPCTSKDIVAILHAYYEWCPPSKRPTKSGKVIEFGKGIVNVPAYREYAENQFTRGIVPSDYIEFLSNLRLYLKMETPDRYARMANNLNIDEKLAFKWLKNLEEKTELPFAYLAPIVEEWVAIGRDWYTEDVPRVLPSKPDITVTYTLGEDIRQNTDFLVDVPPRYISPHEAAGLVDEDEYDDDNIPDERNSWTPADWAKAGMPL